MKSIKHLLLLAFLIPCMASAQDYKTGIGLRGGYPAGITLKHFISEGNAIEAIGGFTLNGASLTVLYEMHANAFDVAGLYWFYGAGVHAGFYNSYGWGRAVYSPRPGFGVDGILGLEYKIQEIPITIGFDIKPGLNFYPFGLQWWESAFSVRYVF